MLYEITLTVSFRWAIQTHCATLNVDSMLGVWRFQLLTLKMWQFLTNFSPLLLEIKNHYKHVPNSPRHISGFQTLSPCRFRQGIVIARSQKFSRFRVINILYEMINEQRLVWLNLTLIYVLFVFKIYIEKNVVIR